MISRRNIAYYILITGLFLFCQAFIILGGGGKDKKPSAGALAFAKYRCNACHGTTGAGVGDLRKAWQKYTDEQLKAYIQAPSTYGNMKMPPFATIIEEKDWPVIIDYVKKLGKDAAAAAAPAPAKH